jgi:hypothetical protein
MVLSTDISITQSVIASLIFQWAGPLIIWLVAKGPARRAVDNLQWLITWSVDKQGGMQWLRWAVFGALFLPIILLKLLEKLAETLEKYLHQRQMLRRILSRPVFTCLGWVQRVLKEAARWAEGVQEQEQAWKRWAEAG